MRYRRVSDLPEWLRPYMAKLTHKEGARFFSPHSDDNRGAEIQEAMMAALEADHREGKNEEQILERLKDYANTPWP